MMKIIGHRGAAGLAPENTVKAIKAGIAAGADAVEFDIRLTKDGEFVLIHDVTMLRTSGDNSHIKDLTLAEIRNQTAYDGEIVATLEDALKACGDTMAVIETKGNGWFEQLAEQIRKYQPGHKVTVVSFHHNELVRFRQLMPGVQCYILERQNAFKAIRFASTERLTGVDLNFWLLNPFSYFYAKLLGLKVIVYTVDRPIYMRYIRNFYPKVGITTNYPNILKKIKRFR